MTPGRWLLLAALLFAASAAQADNAPLPRRLIAFYDSKEQYSPRTTPLHRFLEMPANHLGLDVDYHDVQAPLPRLDSGVRGVVLWFDAGYELENLDGMLQWLHKALDAGKKIVIIENMGIGDRARRDPGTMTKVNHLLARIGLRDDNLWRSITYHAKTLSHNPEITQFERRLPAVLPGFVETRAIGPSAVSHLRILGSPDADEPADLVITSFQGGYAAQNFVIMLSSDEDREPLVMRWYLNPFNFLRLALQTDSLPKPDYTTLNGKRIFYSHIDGDGWNNISEIQSYNQRKALSAEVIYEEILKPYGDFPFNVGLITGEVDDACYGVPDSERIARAIFALPNVFPSSHTHTHPLLWRFFANYSPHKEEPYLDRYPSRMRHAKDALAHLMGSKDRWTSAPDAIAAAAEPATEAMPGRKDPKEAEYLSHRYDTPRSYACKPFDLGMEIEGSIARVNSLSPKNKKTELIQWSGDTSPFEAALASAQKAGVYNINGGDSRFDDEYPSYSSVSPVGLKVGNQRQIYSSNSNENTYTNLWTGRFFGFRYLQTTVQNTESPRRVSPFNVYFHVYSGQKEASLRAVQENLEFARRSDIIPIPTQDYAAIAEGFYTTQITPVGEQAWRISHHGRLQTIRFDHAVSKTVDFNHSTGVIGQKYFQGSLYAFLDPTLEESLISLRNIINNTESSSSDMPYLVESRWEIKSLQNSKNILTIRARGFGRGTMVWQLPAKDEFSEGKQAIVRVERNGEMLLEKTAEMTKERQLFIDFEKVNAIDPVTISVAMH